MVFFFIGSVILAERLGKRHCSVDFRLKKSLSSKSDVDRPTPPHRRPPPITSESSDGLE